MQRRAEKDRRDADDGKDREGYAQGSRRRGTLGGRRKGGGWRTRISIGATLRLGQQHAIQSSQVSSEVLAALPEELRAEIQGAQRAAKSSGAIKSVGPRPKGVKPAKSAGGAPAAGGTEQFLSKMGDGDAAVGFKRAADARLDGYAPGKLGKGAWPKVGTL